MRSLDIDFPSVGFERIELLNAPDVPWENMTKQEKAIYVQGLHAGFYQGKRSQAREIANNFYQHIIGFKP